MRGVIYNLANGTTTTSYKEAKTSNVSYTVQIEPIDPHRTPMSETRKQKLAEHFRQKRLDRLVNKCYNSIGSHSKIKKFFKKRIFVYFIQKSVLFFYNFLLDNPKGM